MLAPRQRPLQLLIWMTLTFLIVIVYRSPTYIPYPEDHQHPEHSQPQEGPDDGNDNSDQFNEPYVPPVVSEKTLQSIREPTNATLGFGAVVVVSKADSPRRHALLQAANVTEIELTIPAQPVWTEDDVNNFKNGPESKMGHGSIYAWLGHHNALRWFLDSGHETALILEDDVDWDIHIRSLQVPLASKASRSLLSPKATEAENLAYPWGSTKDWELLYIGHCGDYFNALTQGIGPGYQFPSNLTAIPSKTFEDPSLPRNADLHPFTSRLMKGLGVPEQQRVIHRSMFPLCTFAYAVTRTTAQRLIDELAPAKEPAPTDATRARAYDVAILSACRNGFDVETGDSLAGGLKCYSVNPELFHHMPGKSHIADVEANRGRKVGTPPVDLAGAKQAEHRNETSNIGCGFYSGHFSFTDGDSDRLWYLQQNVGRKGHCLK